MHVFPFILQAIYTSSFVTLAPCSFRVKHSPLDPCQFSALKSNVTYQQLITVSNIKKHPHIARSKEV